MIFDHKFRPEKKRNNDVHKTRLVIANTNLLRAAAKWNVVYVEAISSNCNAYGVGKGYPILPCNRIRRRLETKRETEKHRAKHKRERERQKREFVGLRLRLYGSTEFATRASTDYKRPHIQCSIYSNKYDT